MYNWEGRWHSIVCVSKGYCLRGFVRELVYTIYMYKVNGGVNQRVDCFNDEAVFTAQ